MYWRSPERRPSPARGREMNPESPKAPSWARNGVSSPSSLAPKTAAMAARWPPAPVVCMSTCLPPLARECVQQKRTWSQITAYACRSATTRRNSAIALRSSALRRTGNGPNSSLTETHVPRSRATGVRVSIVPSFLKTSAVPVTSPAVRVESPSVDSAASELSASPRKPNEERRCRSSNSRSFDV